MDALRWNSLQEMAQQTAVLKHSAIFKLALKPFYYNDGSYIFPNISLIEELLTKETGKEFKVIRKERVNSPRLTLSSLLLINPNIYEIFLKKIKK